MTKPKAARPRPLAPAATAVKRGKSGPGSDADRLGEMLKKVARSLQEVAESLAATQRGFADALFHMPRPSELEPLVAELHGVASRLEGIIGRIPATGGSSAPPPTRAPTLAVAPRIDAARRAVSDALASLPREADYRPVARQLRELASVSPSLLAWLEEIPKLTAPLSASVASLRAAERLLFETHDELIETSTAGGARPAS